ncbi:hypothetical protein AK88_05469 [Plasmodium fragile]|uniref:Schizont-infected cell agglutination C-terminal domain-containing protein n=1 Tax=Plasmodium fragile TaxID=5857 RepID=A0A0D9QD40_PLAFR|nr:uncharacterized protein AK88_05469 [Plasmodium fragile]KJP84899.1 hypothetical protein AK88_05469 [Plasmodium fragile]
MAAKFVELLQQYAKRRSIDTSREKGPGSFQDLIWKDIEIIFKELMIYKRGSEPSINTLCYHRGKINGRQLKGHVQRAFCVDIMRVFFFMDGIKSTTGAGSVLNNEEDELVQYLRCIIGSVYLLKWSKDKCHMEGVIDYVRDAMRGMVMLYAASGGSDKCHWIDMEHIGVGGRIVAAEVEKWMDQNKGRTRKIERGIKICSQEKNRGKHTSEGRSNTGTGISVLLKEKDEGQIRKFIDEEKHMPKEVAQEIIRKVVSGQLDAKKLQEKISEGVRDGWSTGKSTEVNGQPTRGPDAESKVTQTKGGISGPVHTSTTSPPTRSGNGPVDESTTVSKPATDKPSTHEPATAATPSAQVPTASDQSNKTGQDSSPKASGKEKASNGPQGTGTTPSGTSADTSNLGRADVTPGRKDGGSQPQAPASPVLPAAPPPPAPPPEPAPEEGKNGAQGDAAPAPPAGAELGRKGDAGPAGPQGETGAEGEAGPTGPQADPASGAAAGQAPDSKEPRQPGSSAVEDYKSICEHTDSGPQSTTVISSGDSSVSITPVTYTYGAAAPCKFLQELAQQEERAKSTPKTVENTKNATRDRAPSGETNVQDKKTDVKVVETPEDKSREGTKGEPAAPQAAAAPAQPSSGGKATPTTVTTGDSVHGDPQKPSAGTNPGATVGTSTDSSGIWTIDLEDKELWGIGSGKTVSGTCRTSGTGTTRPDGKPDDSGRGGRRGASGSSQGQPPNKAKDDYPFDFDNMLSTKAGSPVGGYVPPTLDPGTHNTTPGEILHRPAYSGPVAPDLTGPILTATTPILFFLSAVTVAFLGYSLWKYFAHLAKRRRTFRTVRDVPSPPLDEEILDHLQRGDLPPPDYGYTMVMDRRPASTSDRRRRRKPRVNRRTIIELHLEVLNECEATEWENVKDDYWQIVVHEFAQELMRDDDTNNTILDVSTSDQDLPGTTVSYTDSDGTDICPPHDPDPWSCMETMQFDTDPCPDDDPDPWSCMETIQLDEEQHSYPCPYSPGTEIPESESTKWIPWIEHNKYLLRQCTGETWFLQLTADWKQYLREHMVANGASGEHRKAATLERKNLDLWRQWTAQQHRQMSMYGQEAWFKHLLDNIAEETVSDTGEVPRVETHLEVEKVMAAQDILIVRVAPRTQLHQAPHMKKPLTAKIWILILALVIEQCEIERRAQEKELYVDNLLEKL